MINYKQIPSLKVITGKGSQNLKLYIWVINGLKIPRGKKVVLGVFANHPAVHRMGVSRS